MTYTNHSFPIIWPIIVMEYFDTQMSHGLGVNRYLFFFIGMYMP